MELHCFWMLLGRRLINGRRAFTQTRSAGDVFVNGGPAQCFSWSVTARTGRLRRAGPSADLSGALWLQVRDLVRLPRPELAAEACSIAQSPGSLWLGYEMAH